MKFLEKNLEDIIWENCQNPDGREKLKRRGLVVQGAMFRQVDLGNYGKADLISIHCDKNKNPFVTVYELKKDEVGINTLLQASRYLCAMKRILGEKTKCKIHLIGSSVETNGEFVYLYNELNFVLVSTYRYDIDGLYFKKVGRGWKLTNEGFKDESIEEIKIVTKNIIDHTRQEEDPLPF